MKGTIISVFAFALLLGAVGVAAEGKKENKFDKPSKAKNVVISEKKALSESERGSLDLLEKELKGKAVKPSPVPTPSAGGVTGVLGSSLPEGGQRYAILIGMANYPGTENDLCVDAAKTGKNSEEDINELAYYCKDEDALNMKRALIDEYKYNEANIFPFSDSEATFDNIKLKIDELVIGTNDKPPVLTEKDELVFFFSGHGSTGIALDENGAQLDPDELSDEAIVIYDQEYKEQDFLGSIAGYADNYKLGKSSFIWDDQLKAWFANSLTKRIFFAFDTCMAGGMNDLKLDGRVLAMSSTETQSSWTYYLGGYNNGTIGSPIYKESEGLFAHYFVKRAMIDELGDGSNPLNKRSASKYDGNVAVEEAFSYAYPIVKAMQTPVLNDQFFNDLLLGY